MTEREQWQNELLSDMQRKRETRMTEHKKEDAMKLYYTAEHCTRPFNLTLDEDRDLSASDDFWVAYEGDREAVLIEAWRDYLTREATDKWYKVARQAIQYLLENPKEPPFVPGPDGAYNTCKPGDIETWHERGTIHGIPVVAVYEIDPGDYTQEQRDVSDYVWDATEYRIVG